MKLKKLAELCRLTVAGSGDQEVYSITYADEALENDIAVAFSIRELKNTQAKIVLTEPVICDTDKTLVYCNYGSIFAAVAKIVQIFTQLGYYKEYQHMPAYTEKSPGFYIGKHVKIGKHSAIYPNVTIGDDVHIGKNCRIEAGVYIGSGTYIGNDCIIHSGARIGASSFLHYDEDGRAQCFLGAGITILGNSVQIGYNTIIQRGTISDTVIEDRVLVGNLVVVGHDVKIGHDSHIVCQAGLAGRSVIGSHVRIMGQSGIAEGIEVEDFANVLAKTIATKNVHKGKTISGAYGREHKEELKIQALLRKRYRRD